MPDQPAAAVLGLGLVGGSLALALRSTGRYSAVAGWDPDFDVQRAAQKAAVADRFPSAPQEAVRQAAAVFITTGAAGMRDVLMNVAPHLAQGAVVCSFDEAHEPVMTSAAETLPGNVSLICANPVLWESVTDETRPSAALFQKGVLALSPTPSAHPDSVAYVADLAGALGMESYFVDAREHDAFYSGIGRLPSLLATALVRVATRQPSWRELSRLAGGQLRDATVPVAMEPLRQQAALGTGGEHLARWLDAIVTDLALLRDGLREGAVPEDYVASAADARARWLHDRQVPAADSEQPQAAEAPRPARRGLFR